MKNRNNLKNNPESGVALLTVIFALLLVTAVATGMILLSGSEIGSAANYRDEQTALFAAKAGLEEARDRMLPGAGSIPLPISAPTPALPGSTGGVYYITASGVSPWSPTSTLYGAPVYDSELNNELTAAGVTSPASGSYYNYTTTSPSYSGPPANPIPYQWVRINLKVDASAKPYLVDGTPANSANQVCYDTANLHEVVISASNCSAANPMYQPVYELTSFAMTPSRTIRMLQQDVVQDAASLILPAALTIVGPGLSSSVICASGSTCAPGGAYISGASPSSCPTGVTVPAVATSDDASRYNFVTGLTPNMANVVGSGSPSVANASAALSNVSTVSQVETLVTQMESMAGTNVGPDCTLLNLGTPSTPSVAVVTNAGGYTCHINSGNTGYGILVVTGSLHYNDVNSYQGVIMMLGTGQFVQGATRDASLPGALFIAQDRDPSTGALLPGPWLGTSPAFSFHHSGGSSADPSIQYNACLINQVAGAGVSNYRVLSQREVTSQ